MLVIFINDIVIIATSYEPDPYAKHIDALTIPWINEKFYCFPPFSCIAKIIRKIVQDKGRGILQTGQLNPGTLSSFQY